MTCCPHDSVAGSVRSPSPRYDGGVRSTTTGEDEEGEGPSSSIGEVLGEVLALLVRPSAVWDRGGET